LREQYDEFARRGAEVVVVGPESKRAFQLYWRAHGLPFVGLPDPTHRVLDLYGQEFKLLKLGRMPAQVIVDRSGIVRFAHYGHSMTDIPGNEEVLALLEGLDADQK